MKQVFFERVSKNAEVFSKTTHIHGFHEIYHAKTLLTKIVWVLIVSGAVVLTVYQVYRSILQYTSETSLSLINPLDPGGLLYPPLSLCFIHWMSWVDWKKAYSMNFTKEGVLFGLSFLTPIFSPTVFNTTEVKRVFMENMALNNISTMSEFYKRVAKPLPLVIGLFDRSRVVVPPPFFNDIDFHLKGSELILCYKVDGEEILQILKNRTNAKQTSRAETQMFNFSKQDFKYRMIRNYVSEEEYSFYVSHWLLTKTNYWLESLSEFKKNFTGYSFPYRMYPDTYSEKHVQISIENDAYLIEMQPSVHRWMNTDDYQCKENEKPIASKQRCLDICKATFMHNSSLCLPLDYGILLKLDIPENLCQNEIYFLPELNSPNNTNKSFSELFSMEDVFSNDNLSPNAAANETYAELERNYNSCSKKCIPPCEIWKYEFTSSFQIIASSARALSFSNFTDVNIIYPSENDVLIVIEMNSQTWEDFVGNVGGLLGVWMGASIVSFLQLFYLCCCYDCSCTRLSSRRKSSILPVHVLSSSPPISVDKR